jgi:hypothetical protein
MEKISKFDKTSGIKIKISQIIAVSSSCSFFWWKYECPKFTISGVQGKNNVYHIKEKMRKTNFKLFGKSFLIVDCIGAFIYIIIAQNIRQ